MARQISIPTLSFDRFPCYDDVMSFSQKLASARPTLCSLSTLGVSRDGKDIPMLTLTDSEAGSADDKPAYIIHAVIHGNELAGVLTALYSARQLLVDHPKNKHILGRLAFHILPMLNPDAADLAARLSMPIRSRWDRTNMQPNTLCIGDVDGDGDIVFMRIEHPDGDHCPDPVEKRLMRPRHGDSEGPFYFVYPEGEVYEFDGDVRAIKRETRSMDWNRQWCHGWEPEHIQRGAGDFPFSEPEMRSLALFLHERKNLVGMMGHHTGACTLFRPPSTGPITTMIHADHMLYDTIGRVGEAMTGFPLSPVTLCHPPDRPPNSLKGHSCDFGYHHLGLVCYEFELGVIYDSMGVTPEARRNMTEEQRIDLNQDLLKWWEKQPKKTREPLWVDWKPFDHPQLGKVDIGGFLARHQHNQTLKQIRKNAPNCHKFCVYHADSAPKLQVHRCEVEDVGGGLHRVRIMLTNRGRFATNITEKGKALKRIEPVRAWLKPEQGVTLLSRGAQKDLGHLPAEVGMAEAEWFVKTNEKSTSKRLATLQITAGPSGNMSIDVSAD